MPSSLQVTVNGEKRELPGPLTVAGLLQSLEVTLDRVAVEVNQAVVPRARHAGTSLSDGDVIEIVTFVGGG